jgi:nicotinamidase-related amidase
MVEMGQETALIVIDVQTGLFGVFDTPYKDEALIETINGLIGKARLSDTPIFLVQHNGEGKDSPLSPNTDGWEIHPALKIEKEDLYIQKDHPDSFQDTQLEKELSSRGIRRLVITGLQTEYCIDTTCRRAYSLGYEVILIENGHSTYDTEHLRADQIINHHNQVLGSWFVTLEKSTEVSFSE